MSHRERGGVPPRVKEMRNRRREEDNINTQIGDIRKKLTELAGELDRATENVQNVPDNNNDNDNKEQ